MDPATDDFGLLQRWRSGDAAAGNLLTARHYHGVLRFFEGRVPRAAQDLTQNTFLACVEAMEQERVYSSFRAFLFGIARNHLLRHLREDRQLARRRDFDASPTGLVAPVTSVSALISRSQEQHFVLRALVALPVEHQVVLQLRYWENLDSREIAEATGVNASTIRTRLQRAKSLLEQEIRRMKVPPPVQRSLLRDLEGWTRSVVAPA